MMPWEHVLVGYIAYSGLVRVLSWQRATTGGAVAVVFGSLLPDLIDKPLAWQFDLFGSGYAIGHSVFTATALSALAMYLGHRRDLVPESVGVVVGYLAHLPGDLLPAVIADEPILFGRLLWPLRSRGDGYDSSFQAELTENLGGYSRWVAEQLATGTPDGYFVGLLSIAGVALVVWVDDGLPIGRELYVGVRQLLSAVRGPKNA